MFISIIMMSLIFTISLFFSQLTQPLTMGLTIVTQTILVSFMSGMLTKSTWFSYILFLIFLGAMLVLFLYVASLAPNETFPLSIYMTVILLMGVFLPIPFILFDQMMLPIKLSMEMSFFSTEQVMLSSKTHIGLMYSLSSMNLTVFIIMYLLLTLIVIVKITNTFFGPLRVN